MENSDIFVGIISLFLLIGGNAFCVAAEYSLAVSRRTRIAELAEQGNTAAKTVQRLMSEPDRFFATTQIGITLMSIAIGIVSEPAFTSLVMKLFGANSETAVNRNVSLIISAVIGLVIASYFQIVLAELVPRTLAQRSAERFALVLVPPMEVLSRLLTPFIWILKTSSRFIVSMMGVRASPEERPHSVEELKMLVAASERSGVLESDQRDMLEAVFTLGDTTVREVMIPRTEIICAEVDTPIHEVVHLLSVNPISRLPVYEGSLDHIVGILHSKDLIRTMSPGTRSMTVTQLMREAYFVPDSQRVDELLQQFRTRREHMAIVVDEYGGTAGLVTLYDLVSEIIGDIGDKSQPQSPDIQRSPDGSAVVNGLTSIGDVNEAFQLKLVDENYDTIGGYIMGRLGRIPRVGDEVDLTALADQKQGHMRVEEMDKMRVALVRLSWVAAKDEAGDPLGNQPPSESS